MSFPYTEIEKTIGYTFRDKSLLKEAFTHSTYKANETATAQAGSEE